MKPNVFIETDRLILREIIPTDVDGLFELDSDPEVHRYLGNKTIQSKEKIVELIEFIRRQYVENGIGRWAVIDKETNAFMGWTGLKYVTDLTNNHKNFYDIGYRLIPKYWGKGIATESAIAVLDYAFNTMKLEKVFASASCENIGSNKILQNIGLRFIETFYYEDIQCNWYRIDKGAYELKLVK